MTIIMDRQETNKFTMDGIQLRFKFTRVMDLQIVRDDKNDKTEEN